MDINLLKPYSRYHIRGIAGVLSEKYQNLQPEHVFWIAKQLGIYPDAVECKRKQFVYMTKMGSINKKSDYVGDGELSRLSDAGIRAIDNYIIAEGYKLRETEGKMENIWEQVDLITKMKSEYEKAVAERDEAKSDAEQYCAIADKYEKEIEELKDKLLIAEKENNSLISEKQELAKMQIDVPNFAKEVDSLQQRIGKYNAEINMYSSEVNELRKNVALLQTSVNRLQENKKKLEAVISDLIGCSKRLMNLK